MRIFGKVIETFRLPRRLSGFPKARHYCNAMCVRAQSGQRLTNVKCVRNFVYSRIFATKFPLTTTSRMYETFGDNNTEIGLASTRTTTTHKGEHNSSASRIMPVALLNTDSHNEKSLKILLIPLNLFEADDEALKKTLATLSIIRENARQIEAFTDNLTDPSYVHLPKVTEPEPNTTNVGNNTDTPILNEFEGQEDITIWQHPEENIPEIKKENESQNTNLYESVESSVAEGETEHLQPTDSFDVVAWDESKRHVLSYVPESLEEKLKQMAISSVQLGFEMNMTNIRDALMRNANAKNMELLNTNLKPRSLKDPVLALTTCLDMEPYNRSAVSNTVPLNFNALIQGTVEVNAINLTPEQMREINVPKFNDYVTTIAANICSSALQKGFPADISRMAYSTKSNVPLDNKSKKETNPYIVCVREGDKGCISPGNASNPPFVAESKSSSNNTGASSSAAGAGENSTQNENASLLTSSAIIGGYSARGLMSCKAYARAIEESAKRREMLKNAKCKSSEPKKTLKSCTPPTAAQSTAAKPAPAAIKLKDNDCTVHDPLDPCCRKDPCAKEDPCAKKEKCVEKEPIKAPCNKPGSCKKKNDPCVVTDKKPCKFDGQTDAAKVEPSKKQESMQASTCNKPPKCDAGLEKEKPKKKPIVPCPSDADDRCRTDSPKKKNPCTYGKRSPPRKGKGPCKADEKDSGPCIKKKMDPCPPTSESRNKKPVKPDPCEKMKEKEDKDNSSKCSASKASDNNKSDKPKKPEVRLSDKPTCGSVAPKINEKSTSDKPVTCGAKTPQKVQCGGDPCSTMKPCPPPCPPPKTDAKCEAPKKEAQKCSPPKKEAPKSPPPKKESKCSPPKKDAKCESSKKEAPKSPPPKKECGPPKKDAKCESPKKEAPKSPPPKKECGPPKKDASKSGDSKSDKPVTCGAKTPQKVQCGGDPCSTMKPCSPPCPPPKTDAKCESPKKDTPKCTPPKKEAKSESPKKEESKCQPPKTDSKCADTKPDKGKQGTGPCSKKKAETKPNCPKKDSKSDKDSKSASSKKEKKCGPPKKESKSEPAKKESTSKCKPPTPGKVDCKKPSESSKKPSESSCANKGKGGTSPCTKKKFSTSAINVHETVSNKRYICTFPLSLLKVRYNSFSMGASRFYGKDRPANCSKDGKQDQNDNSKCKQFAVKFPKSRKQEKKKPKDCFPQEDGCRTVSCKDPSKSSCKNRKENKNSTKRKFSTSSKNEFDNFQMKNITRRNFRTSSIYNKTKNNKDNGNDEKNEIIKIASPCTVEKCIENVPDFSDYDVLVRVASVAISGSDVHVYETGGCACPGMTLGHDASGIVEKVGKCINNLKPGDRVVMEAGLSCGICELCKRGIYHMCTQLIYNGFFSKYQVHPADLCHKLPNCIAAEEAALTQTLALGCQACFKARILPTTNVLIIGSSPTAVSAALCARALGAKCICIICTAFNSLELMRKCYDFNYVHYENETPIGEILENVFAVLHGWPTVVINCAITERTMNTAIMSLQTCGTCVLAECESECACFNALDMLMKNLRLVSSFRSTNMFPIALQLMESGQAPIYDLIARVYPWDQVEMAFQSAQHESNVGNKKVIVRCAEEENSGEETKT